ncbi:MAG: plastocyanin/azurin family copper-binding protein [Actinomycetota bacterium]
MTCALAIAVIAAACSSGGDESGEAVGSTDAPTATAPPDSTDPSVEVADDASDESPTTSQTPETTAPETTAADTTTTVDPAEVATAEQINDYVAEAAAFDQVGADAQFPAGLTFSAGGAPGYSRYVFRENGVEVVPTLVEGPIDDAVRCQDPDLPCSYLELKELHESDGDIPTDLRMTSDELAELVAQLDELSAYAIEHRDIDDACAAGFISDRIQTPNMGTHLYLPSAIGNGFDPGEPEILLYARADDTLPNGPVGQCVGGEWQGEPMKLIGTSFIIPPQVIGDEHPDTFAGPLDNWHIHYNLCRGSAEGRDSFVPRDQCEAGGGSFSLALGWMIHAWVDPEHDNQLGVFSMWNDSVAPVLDADSIRDSRQVTGSDFPDGAEQSLITDFAYTGDLRVDVGQSLFFNNVDAVPHTVSAGSFESPELDVFDSGLMTPGQNFELTFDQPGVYSLFCTLHPDMAATVTVD